MKQAADQDKTINLPRFHQEFIGLGHELQQHRRQRKQVQLEHQAIENRVLLLQKQQYKARKNLLKKKKHLQQIINIKQRQQQQSQQKKMYMQQKMEQLERLKRQNEIIRMIHKNNFQNSVSQIRDRNHSDYSRIRQQRLEGQYSKRVQKNQDMQQKRENWISLNIQKQKGKQRVDSFYKSKNLQHVKQYQSRILIQNERKQSQINQIKNLQELEQDLKLKLQHTTMKNSKMQQLLRGVSRTLSPMNISTIQAQLFRTSRAKNSYETLDISEKQKALTRTNSIISERQKQKGRSTTRNNSIDHSLFHKNGSKYNESLGQQVEQNIELGQQQAGKTGFKLIRKRKKNKHVNRYKQYEAY